MFFYARNLGKIWIKYGAILMFRSWFKGEEGATAVEFAIVGIPFIFLLIGLIEVSLMYTANSLLQDATSQAARLIRTGQVQQAAADPEGMFSDELCRVASVFLNCAGIEYEVVALPGGFGEADDTAPVFDGAGNFESRGFSPGGVNDVVLIRTVYHYPLMTPILGSIMADSAGQTKLMVSTIVLQTEPYEFDMGG